MFVYKLCLSVEPVKRNRQQESRSLTFSTVVVSDVDLWQVTGQFDNRCCCRLAACRSHFIVQTRQQHL